VPAAPAPQSSYRLQLQPRFGFADAAGIAGYLAHLGVTHAYLSPILQAAPGSVHGYDVVDHSRISADLGGEGAFRDMVAQFRRHGLGVIADIVPNHMAISAPESLNRQFWSVLRDGAGSAFAHWFDIDWQAGGGRLLLPILAGPLADCLGDLAVDASGPDGPVLRYHEHVLPVRPGTADLPLPDLAAAQHYRLADWRAAAAELNWRRFFDITSLIAVRVEDEDVFAATHGLLLRLVAEGLVDGLRVDHPDGLADPRGYLDRLAKATGGAWVVTEKILTGTEELPPDWRCAGTTGYDALGMAGGLFVDPAGAAPLTAAYAAFTADTKGFPEVAEVAKREAATGTLAAEVRRLARLLARMGDPALAGLGNGDLVTVLTELLTAFGVYRAYVVPGEPPPAVSARIVAAAAGAAADRLPERLHPPLAAVAALALGEAPASSGHGPVTEEPGRRPAGVPGHGVRGLAPGETECPPGLAARDEFVIRFQQTCGPVMAKGVEDTAFYRWPRLAALNEVGGEPDRFGIEPGEFHAFAARLARDWPATMTTLSTHDTKRQEEVRARLAVLAELPGEWAREVARWHDRAIALASGSAPEPGSEYLLWQTLLGAWPIGYERAAAYLTKAMREAKTATSWRQPNPGYEAAALAFAAAALADRTLTGQIAAFAGRIAAAARVNSLGAKLVQLTMPGAADVYQGCELAAFALVDPDNRRPVDYERRRALLAAQDAGAAATELDTEKLLVTSRALRLRRDHPDWFAGGYAPVAADGPAAGHVVAFRRGHAMIVATRLPVGLAGRGGWAGTALPVSPGRWRDVLTGAAHEGPRPLLSDILGRGGGVRASFGRGGGVGANTALRLPVAILIPTDA
jgi:malto-oligosyltrehalose synthase